MIRLARLSLDGELVTTREAATMPESLTTYDPTTRCAYCDRVHGEADTYGARFHAVLLVRAWRRQHGVTGRYVWPVRRRAT